MIRRASFSRCGSFRYSLTRQWDSEKPQLLLIGLNPSRADACVDDPTIRRCIGLSTIWGFGGFVIVNLFSYRSPHPAVLKSAEDPIGPRTNRVIRQWLHAGRTTVAMWGNHGQWRNRDAQVHRWFKDHDLRCAGCTDKGAPRHLLYVRNDAPLIEYTHSGSQASGPG